MKSEDKSREERITDWFVKVAERSMKILEYVEQHPDDLLGIMKLLNPDENDTVGDYRVLTRLVKEFHFGEILHVWLVDWHGAAMNLIDILQRQYPMIASLNKCRSAQCGLYKALHDPDMVTCDEEMYIEVERKVNALIKAYRENSDAMQQLAAEAKARKEASQKAKKCRGTNWRRTDSRCQQARMESAEVIREINRRYAKAAANGRKRSRMEIVREMLADSSYMARMRGKKAATWANQASSRASEGG